jgi:hypothetical protein
VGIRARAIAAEYPTVRGQINTMIDQLCGHAR